MKCRICGYNPERLNCTCLCGFCTKCITQYGHDNCEKIVKGLEKEEKNGK